MGNVCGMDSICILMYYPAKCPDHLAFYLKRTVSEVVYLV
jgi:hypothetical protein